MHENSQIKAVNIYIELIYTYTNFRLGMYSLYICTHSDLGLCTQTSAQYLCMDIYINVYRLESWPHKAKSTVKISLSLQ